MMMPFMKRQMRRRQLGDLERFGAMVESGQLTSQGYAELNRSAYVSRASMNRSWACDFNAVRT